MSVKLTITVADITSTISLGYTHIKIYRSPEELTGFFEITTPSIMVVLQPGVSVYEFIDTNGTTTHWYRTTFYDSNTPAETSYSTSFQGEFTDTNYKVTTYPEEGVYTSYDRLVVSKVRTLIGDSKELTRDYVSADTGYSSISVDGYTHTLSNPKGWPLSINLDGFEYTTLSEPSVNGYQFVTFSGTQISTISGTLDVWYYHFRYSDSEILYTFNALLPPYPLDAEDVTFELKIICTAIELLSAELGVASANSGVEVDIFEEIRINPKTGLDSRFANLKRLLADKQAIIDGIDGDDSDIFGVLVD
jgi:hypothetical protein